VARSSSGGVAIRYVLPVLWMYPDYHFFKFRYDGCMMDGL